MNKIERIRRSLVYKITVSLILIVVILLNVLILSNIYSLNVVASNMINASQSQLAIYMNNIRNNLDSSLKDLNEISVAYLDSIAKYPGMSELDKYLSAVQIRDTISTKVLTSNVEDGLFVLLPEDGLSLAQFSNRIVSNEKMELWNYINSSSMLENSQAIKQWDIVRIKERNYLVRCNKTYNCIVGVIIKNDTLLAFINNDPLEGANYALTDKDGKIIAFLGASHFNETIDAIPNEENIYKNYKDKYFIVSREFPHTGGKLSCIIERKSVFYGLELIQWIIIFMGILAVIIIPVVILYLFREIIKPVQALVVATREVEKGNWDYNVPLNKAPMEFITLNNSFNSMIREIKALKIKSYEEKIERQKAELKYLQMQIKPHFFLNAITTISSLTYQDKNKEIRQLIEFLSRHLRYVFRGGLHKVPLREEIEHVKNYIGMQEIKYPNNIIHLIEVKKEIEECLLPQFLIQTFVENSFKHALTSGKILSVFIKAEDYIVRDETYVRLVIEDNGDGFPDDVMKIINEPDENGSEDGKKIGILNIKKTLRLLYKMDGLLKIGNCDPSGAMVEILIPYERGEFNAQPPRG
ncbi:MAG: sensor histidine kinase [Bacillota bacterium]